MAKMTVKLIDNEKYVSVEDFLELSKVNEKLFDRVLLLELYTELIGSSPENAIKKAREVLGKEQEPYEDVLEIFK